MKWMVLKLYTKWLYLIFTFRYYFLVILKINSVKDVRWEILALIMVFFYPIFHLIPTLALIIFISTLSLSNSILNKMSNTKVDTDKKYGFSGFKLTLLILLLIWGITWISSFYLWDDVIKNLYTLINEEGLYSNYVFSKKYKLCKWIRI